MNLLEKFKLGLNKSSSSLSEGINNIFKKRKVDQDILQEFEDLLIGSDVGIEISLIAIVIFASLCMFVIYRIFKTGYRIKQ